MNKRCIFLLCCFLLAVALNWGMAGTYTIDNTQATVGTNFTSFSDAINALNTGGASAPVTFNVKDGQTFSEDCPVITATGSAANPIAFQRDGSGSVRPVIHPVNAINAICISGGDYITFDGIDIWVDNSNTATTCGYRIEISGNNGSQYNTVKNCHIRMNLSVEQCAGVFQYGYTASNLAMANSYNVYDNISVENSYHGIVLQMYLYSSSYFDEGCQVVNCTVGGPEPVEALTYGSRFGIAVQGQRDVMVQNNEVRNIWSFGGNFHGIYFQYGNGESHIRGNRIHDIRNTNTTTNFYQYGIWAVLNAGLTSAKSVKIHNNMIWNLENEFGANTTNAVYGIYLNGEASYCSYHVDFNSISLRTGSGAGSYGIFFYRNSAVNFVRNNIVDCSTPSLSFYEHICLRFYRSTIGAAGSISDHNILHTGGMAGAFPVQASSTEYYLTDWTIATGHDANSFSTDPIFVSITNLHLQPDSTSDALGNASYFAGSLNWVTTDIDGEIRDATAPDIGADEANAMGLEIPVVTISQADGSILLVWDPVPGAANYRVEAALEPLSDYTQIALTANTSHSEVSAEKKFYRVIALSE